MEEEEEKKKIRKVKNAKAQKRNVLSISLMNRVGSSRHSEMDQLTHVRWHGMHRAPIFLEKILLACADFRAGSTLIGHTCSVFFSQ